MAQACAELGRRVVVLGLSGSGKTTLATTLARALGVTHVELDALQWEPDWTTATRETLRTRVAAATAGDAWLVDGNYSQVRDLVWPRATSIIWLDYPFWLVMARLFRRTIWRGLWRVELWNGNRERLWTQFLTKDSLFLWIIQQWPKHQREYPLIPLLPEAAGARFIRLRSPRAAARMLDTLCPPTTPLKPPHQHR